MSTNTTLELLRASLAAAGNSADLAKAATFVQPGSATVGLQPFDLEPAAKNLYPVLTPLRNRIPRVGGGVSIQANWKGVVAIDAGQIFAGISEGHRGSVISVATKEYFAAYRTLGAESAVTDEAQLAAADFDDVRARAQQSMLQSLMIAEEKIILGGNTNNALGISPTPTLVASTTGGSIPATTTVSVACVALTFDGKQRATVAGGVQAQVNRVTADGFAETFGGGSAQKSPTATVVTGAGATNSVTCTVTPKQGAYGYAWYAGAAGNEMLFAVTAVSQVVLAALPSGGQLLSSLPNLDSSTNSLVHDGLLGMIGNAANGSYYFAAQPGQGLTADGQGGIVEFDNALQYFWDVLRLSPSRIVISSQEMLWIRRKILTASNPASSARFTFTVNPGQITGGGMPKGYLNPFAMSGGPAEIPFELHPNMVPGTVMFMTDELPYPMANINNVLQVRTRKDYYSIEWPKRTRAYEYGVYTDQVLQNYFTPAFGVITNLSPV